jgi:hypothetical protein
MGVATKTIRAGDIIRYDGKLWLVRTLDKKRHRLVRVRADQKSVEPQYTEHEDGLTREVAIIHLQATVQVVQSYGD